MGPQSLVASQARADGGASWQLTSKGLAALTMCQETTSLVNVSSVRRGHMPLEDKWAFKLMCELQDQG